MRKLTEGETTMKVSQLIGLGEEQRKIYECLERNKIISQDLSKSYIHHQEGLELLIKYQGTLNGDTI